MTAYMVAADKNIVVFSYLSEDVAKKALAAVKSADASLAADAGVAATAAKLPTDAAWYAYLSPSGTIEFVNNTLATFLAPRQGDQAAAVPRDAAGGLQREGRRVGGLEADLHSRRRGEEHRPLRHAGPRDERAEQ